MTILNELRNPIDSSELSSEEIDTSLIELEFPEMSDSNTCLCIGPNGSFELLTHRECLKDALPTFIPPNRRYNRNHYDEEIKPNNVSVQINHLGKVVDDKNVDIIPLTLKLSTSTPELLSSQKTVCLSKHLPDHLNGAQCIPINDMAYLHNSRQLCRQKFSRASRCSTTGNMSSSNISSQYKVAGLSVNSKSETHKFDRVAAFMQRPRHLYSRLIEGYTQLLVKYPIIFFAIAVSCSSIICGFALYNILTDPPDFSEPGESFQTIGTDLSGRMTQFDAIKRKFSYDEKIYQYSASSEQQNLESIDSLKATRSRFKFCNLKRGPIDKPRFIVKLKKEIVGSILSLKYIKKLCDFEKTLRRRLSSNAFYDIRMGYAAWLPYERRLKDNSMKTVGCHPWSLPSYIAYLANKPKCTKIVAHDIEIALNYLNLCLPFYNNKSMNIKDCTNGLCRDFPLPCRFEDGFGAAIYEIFYFILPNTLKSNYQTIGNIDRVLTVLPALGVHSICQPFYKYFMHKAELILGPDLYVEAIELDCTNKYIELILENDVLWISVGLLCVFIIMCVFTRSFVLSIITVLIILYSLVSAHFIYKYILKIDYFPFINMMAAILAIAIGADDLFIYCHIWRLTKQDTRDLPSNKLVSDTLRHTCLSIFVTSLSTSAALFTNLCSSTVAVKCFSVYAASVIIINFIFMITWTPPIIVILEKCSLSHCCEKYCFKSICKNNLLKKLSSAIKSKICYICSECIPQLITAKPLIPCLLSLVITLAASIVVFVYPGYSFSNYNKQFLVDNHPLEKYSTLAPLLFNFENDSTQATFYPISFVWGYLPQDMRNTWDPRLKDDVVYLTPDKNSNLTAPESQKWLLQFCNVFTPNLPFRRANPLSISCPMETSYMGIDSLYTFVKRNECSTMNNNWDKIFPMPPDQFSQCVGKYQSQGQVKPYLMENNVILGLVITFSSNVTLSAGFKEVDKFYKSVDNWFNKLLADPKTPAGMKNGFFVSYFHLYDLELDVASFKNIALSVCVAAVIMFFTTRHLYLSIISMFIIFSIMLSLGASVILLKWKLDIVESIIITLAVGLSIDVCVHFSVAYNISKKNTKRDRAKDSFMKAGFPVFAAALTTASASLPVLNSELLAYERMSIFLILLAFFSFSYSSIFMVALLAVPFPGEETCRFQCPRFLKCFSLCGSSMPARRVDKTVYSDYDLSSSYSAVNRDTPTEL